MITPEQVQVIKDLVGSAQSFLIVFSSDAKYDAVTAAFSLYLGLTAQGKNVVIASPQKELDQKSELIGVENLQNQLGNRNLQVSFDYSEEAVEKVSYNIDEENGKFHLIVQPKKGQKPLDTSSVQYSYTGVDADVIFVIGTRQLADLEQLYWGNERVFEDTSLVSFNTYETSFGLVKLSTDAGSLSESLAFLLQQLDIEISPDMATNLLGGIEDLTNGFRSLSTTAETFEIVSKLMKLGGRRTLKKPVGDGVSKNGFAQALGKTAPPVAEPEEVVPLQETKKKKKPVFEDMPRMEGSRV